MASKALEGEEKAQISCVQSEATTSPPFKWICSIECSISKPNGREISWRGTGFKINFPLVNYTVVVTAAQNLWDKDEKAKPGEIILKFPDIPPITVSESNCYFPEEYKTKDDKSYDYGIIFYETESTECDGFGWSTQITDKELLIRDITVCGFPKDPGSIKTDNLGMSIAVGEITKVEKHQLHYFNATMSAKSGSPLFISRRISCWTVVGIHTTESTGYTKIGRRLDLEVISRIVRGMDCQKALQSVKNSNAHLYCKQSSYSFRLNITSWEKLNCQYGSPDKFGKFYIYPVSMLPSMIAGADDYFMKFVVESVQYKKCFIYMHHKYMGSAYNRAGGGEMHISYCSEYNIGPNNQFYLKEEATEDGIAYSFICVDNPHCRIRMDASSVTEFQESGSGIVNCQYFETPTDNPTNENRYVHLKKKSYQNSKEFETIKIVAC